ncbi:hypothetical protein OG21DRAFT_790527 [Imleria badia]|nr:hypothetical protein OG21DRAFT_790527 [Imleria badia]
MQEYERAVDKGQFLTEKKQRCRAIHQHAWQCERWQRQVARERKDEHRACLWERHKSILERLRRLGYEHEISYFGHDRFRESGKKTHKPLTDKEWDRILPEWLETMNHHRQMRLIAVVHQLRRLLLASQYDIYVKHQSPDTPIFGLLPHVADLVTLLSEISFGLPRKLHWARSHSHPHLHSCPP